MNAATRYARMAACVGLLVGAQQVSAEATTPKPAPRDTEIGIILDQPLPEAAYSKRSRCLSVASYRNVEVLDGGHLVFWGSRGRVWLNQLGRVCAGLAKDQILTFNLRGNRICALDNFHGVSRGGGIVMLTATCNLKDFELISQAQAEQLREWLKHGARASPNVPVPEPAPSDG